MKRELHIRSQRTRSTAAASTQPLAIVAQIAALLSIGAAACTKEQPLQNPGAPLSPRATREFQSCSQDDDCMYVQNGCCDCANGGEDLAINKKFEKAFLAKRTCSEKFPCTMMGRIPACGSGEVSCNDGLCAYAQP